MIDTLKWSFLFLMVIFTACTKNPLKIDVSSIKEEVQLVRYEKELFALTPVPGKQEVAALRNRYPGFTDLFCHRVIRIGDVTDETGMRLLGDFLSDSTILEAKKIVERQFSGFSKTEKIIVRAFRHYRYYFPEKPLPVLYTCISGFNESVFVADGIIGISLDKYLGRNCKYYTLLGLPRYKQRKMIAEMIPSDVIRSWGMSEFEISRDATTLLDHIVHEGKLLYFTEAVLQGVADTLLTGFTEEELKWCRMNESQMWKYLVEKNLLFSTRQMDIVRYINDGPTTNGFPSESPARTGAWIGWQIIRNFMKRNPEVTLSQLMEKVNYREILNASKYSPQ